VGAISLHGAGAVGELEHPPCVGAHGRVPGEPQGGVILARAVRSLLGAVALAAWLVLGGPASAQPQKTFVYQCEDGTQLTVTFPRFRFARLELDGRTVLLTRRISASGSRYSKRRVSFWIKGREATLVRGPRSTTCRTG
jgi:membrane-bound inhibitor of C-type lysozyme